MLKKYLSDLAFIQVLNLLIKPVWILIIDRTVQNRLSQQDYGEYFALQNFTLIFFIVLDLGITSFNATTVSRDPKKLRSLFGNLFGLKIMLSILFLFLVLVFGSFFGFPQESLNLLLMLCVVQILTSFNQYFRSSISAFQRFKWDGVFMVLDRLIIIILCSFLIWGSVYTLDINSFVLAQIVGLFIVSVLLVIYIYYRLERVKLSFSLRKVFPLLRQTWPFGLLVALMGLYNYLDGVMLKTLALNGDEEAGVYAMGYRLYFAVFMFAQVFSNVLLSMFSRHIKDRQALFKLSTFNGKLLFLGGMALALASWVYREAIITGLYPDKYSENAAQAFGLLMFSFPGSALILVYGTLMTARKQMKRLNYAAGITLLINLILNYILIPEEGATGAAKATLVSQVLFGIACFLLSLQTLRFRYTNNDIVRFLSGIILLVLGIYTSSQYLENAFVHLSLIGLTTALALWLSEVFSSRSLNKTR